MTSRRLPLQFDAGELGEAVNGVRHDEWVRHFNARDYEGEWTGVALRSVDGTVGAIYPDPTASGRFHDTELLDRLPYLRSVLAEFQCGLDAVRLLRLAAGSSIREHRDHGLGRVDGTVRLHVPVVTDDAVEVVVDGVSVAMRPGETWYLDVGRPHRVDNRSAHARVHLVLDCVVDDWLDEMLGPVAVEPESADVASAARWTPIASAFRDPLVVTIVTFLRSIGLEVVAGELDVDRIVPGIAIDGGVIVVDETRLQFPGDLLHEAGHIAVAEPDERAQLRGDVGAGGGEEMAAIAWSYAAAIHLGIDPAVVFHDGGYRGGAAAIIENFAAGRYVGVPLLEWWGLAQRHDDARGQDSEPFPAMREWVRSGPADTADHRDLR